MTTPTTPTTPTQTTPTPVPLRRPPRTAARATGVAVAVAAVASLVAVLGVTYTGAAVAGVLADPGALVRWGLPVVRSVADVAAAVAVGALVLGAVAVPPREGRPQLVATRLGAAAAGVWALAAAAVVVLTYASVSGQPVSAGEQFGYELLDFTSRFDLGRSLAAVVLLAALAATAGWLAMTTTGAAVAALLALAALVPLALTGHAGGNADHETAVTSLGLHLVGVTAWVGGVVALAALARRLGEDLPVVAERASRLFGWAFLLVAASGVVNASTRLAGPEDLTTPYGVLLLGKVGVLVLLGVAGWWHRTHALAGLGAGRPRAFSRLLGAELLLMATATGLGAALSRTAPPVPEVQPAATTAEAVLGVPLPPEPAAASWLLEWRPDLLWLVVAAAMAGGYLAATRRLRARGDAWPVHRTALWLVGVALLVWVTSAGPAAYGRVLFSAHMVQHMVLTMLVPIPLVLAAPVTLALRALRARDDGSRGAREHLLALVRSRWLHVVSHPVVAAVVFAGSLVVFYSTDLYVLSLRTHLGHELMTAHFLLAGYLFANVVVGTDPGPPRPSPPLRLVLLFATMAFHAFFFVSLISAEEVLAQDWYGSLDRPYATDLLADQRDGAALGWGLGELPTIALALLVAVQWARSDDREGRRRDRAADRDGDAELAAYNRMLAARGRMR